MLENRVITVWGAYLFPALALAVLIILWEIGVHVFQVPLFILPPPSTVAIDAWTSRAALLDHTLTTLWESLAGFGLSIVIGIPLAALIALSPLLRSTIYPLLVITQAVPKVALAPLIVIVMGIGAGSKIVVAFLVAFFPIVVDTAAGLRAAPPELLDLSRSLKASKLQEFLKIRFPTAIPFIFSGLRIAIALSVVGAVVGEFVQAEKGLGYLIIVSATYWKTGLGFAAMIMLSLMGIVLFWLIGVIERFFFRWHVNDT